MMPPGRGASMADEEQDTQVLKRRTRMVMGWVYGLYIATAGAMPTIGAMYMGNSKPIPVYLLPIVLPHVSTSLIVMHLMGSHVAFAPQFLFGYCLAATLQWWPLGCLAFFRKAWDLPILHHIMLIHSTIVLILMLCSGLAFIRTLILFNAIRW
jgi:hypothetical protein